MSKVSKILSRKLTRKQSLIAWSGILIYGVAMLALAVKYSAYVEDAEISAASTAVSAAKIRLYEKYGLHKERRCGDFDGVVSDLKSVADSVTVDGHAVVNDFELILTPDPAHPEAAKVSVRSMKTGKPVSQADSEIVAPSCALNNPS